MVNNWHTSDFFRKGVYCTSVNKALPRQRREKKNMGRRRNTRPLREWALTITSVRPFCYSFGHSD